MESKVLSFTGQFDKEQVPFKDFKTHQTVEGKFTDRYYFECYDITDPNHPSELWIWERGPTDAKKILFWLSKSQNVLEVTRHGQPNNISTTYEISPPMKWDLPFALFIYLFYGLHMQRAFKVLRVLDSSQCQQNALHTQVVRTYLYCIRSIKIVFATIIWTK